MAQQNPADLGQHRTQWPLAILLLVVLGAAFGYLVYRDYELSMSRERDSLLAHARVIDENLSQQLSGASAALTNVRDDVVALIKSGQEAQISNRLKALSDAMPGVRTMLAIDISGKVIGASRADLMGLDLGKRPYLQQPKAHSDLDTLYVSEPFTTALGVFSLNLMKIWTDEKGRYSGAVTATLDPEYFAVLLRSVLDADGARSTLLHGNGKAFMSMPKADSLKELDLLSAGSIFALHRQSGDRENLFRDKMPATDDERLVGIRTTQPADLNMDQPLIAAVSRPISAVLAPWRTQAQIYALLYCLLAATVVVAGRLVQLKRQALKELWMAREQESREQAEKLNLALASGDLGSWHVDFGTGARTADARAQEMIGRGPEDPVDDLSQWLARVHPDNVAELLAERDAHRAGSTEAFVADYRVRHQHGHWVWIHSRGKVTQRDIHGRALGITGTYMDVSERKAAEAQIARSAELLARMSRVSRTGGWEYDLKTGRSTWSPEMFRIRELDPSVALDEDIVMDAFLPESRALLAAARIESIVHQTPWDMELQMTTAKGNPIWVRSQGEAVVENGKTVALTGTLKNVTWRKQSQIDLKIANEKLERMALTDGLTGIGNRRLFDQTLQAEWLRSARTGRPLALLMIDIDHFKLYNDHYGHVGGDECLRRVAQLLAACTRRAGDLVSRFGGEEFAVLLPNTDLGSARTVAQACLDTVHEAQIVHATSPIGPWLSISIGVASVDVNAAQPALSLLEQADAALYRAKHLGRARHEALRNEA